MKKLTDNEAKVLIENTKKEYSNLHHILLIYKSEDEKEMRFSQSLESNAIDTIISIL